MNFFRYIIIFLLVISGSFVFAQQGQSNQSFLEQQLSSDNNLKEQIEHIATSFTPSLLDSDRTRIIILDFATEGNLPSILGTYVRKQLQQSIAQKGEFDTVEQLIVIKELVEEKLPIGSLLDNSKVISLADLLKAEAIISGKISFEGTTATISVSLYSDAIFLKSTQVNIPISDVIKTAASTPTSEYPPELLHPQTPDSKPSFIEQWTEKFIERLGKIKPFWIYFIVSFIAFIENIFPPFPSDAVVVFGGYLIGVGKVKYWILLLGSTVGSTIGFMLAYYIGVKCSATKLSQMKMKYVPVDALVKVGAWFSKYGYTLIVVNRFLAGTRAVVSFFAGLSGLPLFLTTVLSFFSALAWNALLLYGGKSLGKNWQKAITYIEKYSHIMLYVFIAAAIISGVVYLLKFNKKNANTGENQDKA